MEFSGGAGGAGGGFEHLRITLKVQFLTHFQLFIYSFLEALALQCKLIPRQSLQLLIDPEIPYLYFLSDSEVHQSIKLRKKLLN